MRDLETYRRKRDPEGTPEPFGEDRDPGTLPASAPRRFVVQQHAARRMHWDLRLEVDGVLASWAVPRGPSLDPAEKRLAVRTEDHPLEYADFEGVIPQGNYGAGAMIVWDLGTYHTVDAVAPGEGLAAGKLDLQLDGHKLRGRFALVRTRQNEGRDWLLLRKGEPPEAPGEVVEAQPGSVLSGLSVAELGEGVTRDAVVEEALGRLGAPRADLAPEALSPMLAATGDGAFSGDDWIFELKYDGVRVVAEKRPDGDVVLRARQGADRTHVYPEIARAVARLPVESFVLDGEIVALDERGRSSFERMQRRFTQSDPGAIARVALEVPVVYYVFDLLAARGRDLRREPLLERKEVLASFAPRAGVVRFADHVSRDGEPLFEAAAAHGLEGVVAKRADSTYLSGRRSRRWLKLKVPRSAPLVVVGLTPGKGSRRLLGSVALAWWRGDRLVFAGNAGSGLRGADVDALLSWADAAEVPAPCFEGGEPAAGTRFLPPERVCEVRFTEVTSAGLLRHPVFLRFLPDADPSACRAPESLEAPRLPPAAAAPSARGAADRLQTTRLDKVFWPGEGITKGDLLAYYEAVWPWLAPYLRDRPVVLTRYPDGIAGKSFYQKNAPDFTPAWATRESIEGTDYFICNDLRTLLYVVNSGAIPLHVWSARRDALDRPDWAILDLDPKEAPFADVVRIARHLHRLLDELGAPHVVKTSGQAGLHVLVPLARALDHGQARMLAEALARVVVAELPDIATVTRPVAARGDRVYVDYLQNGRGKLIAAPFSVRPRPGAPVSMPLRWAQVTARLDPARFHVGNVPRLLARGADPLCPLLEAGADVGSLLGALGRRLG